MPEASSAYLPLVADLMFMMVMPDPVAVMMMVMTVVHRGGGGNRHAQRQAGGGQSREDGDQNLAVHCSGSFHVQPPATLEDRQH